MKLRSFVYFRKCDFQIHTPRDPGWSGSRPCGLGENLTNRSQAIQSDVNAQREAWATEFVDACISKGLSAVAITDHHEMVLAEWVRKELKKRKDAGNDPDIWFFPGIELTLKDGVQCLVLFDPSLDLSWWAQAQSKLGIHHPTIDVGASIAICTMP